MEVSKYCIVQKSRKKLPPADSKVKVRFEVQTCISQFPLPAEFPKTYDSTRVCVLAEMLADMSLWNIKEVFYLLFFKVNQI